MTTTQKKINPSLDSVTAQALFKAVAEMTNLNKINYTMIKVYRKRNNPLKPIAKASEFYVQGIKDTITKTSEGLDTFKDWSDLDLLNNKEGWEELGIAKGTLLSGMYQDTHGNSFPIPQTMAGVEIDTYSDEVQAWRSLHFHHLHCLNHKQSSLRFWADVSKTRTRRAGRSKDSCMR
jgi:hypothetical protein